MEIETCRRKAEREGFDKATFDLVGPSGRMSCKWLDAYFGFFTVEGVEGACLSRDFEGMPVWCENFSASGATESTHE